MDLNEIDDFEEGFDEKPNYDVTQEPDLIGNDSVTYSNLNDENSSELENLDTQNNEDIIESLLKIKGINPNSVKFENADGLLEEKSFYDLTKEDQLQLLNFNNTDDNYGLQDDEINLINQIRQSNLSVSEYNNLMAKNAVQEYIKNNSEQPSYQVDSIPDDDLFLIDLKARIPDLSDDELILELDSAKQNIDLYNKKVQSIREEYQQKENLLEEQQKQEQLKLQQEQADAFEHTIVDTISNNQIFNVGSSQLELSNEDMEDIASFILDSDQSGTRYIAKALNDPQTLVKMVWYATKGDEAFNQISNYYKQKITEAARYNYNKGYEDAQGGKSPNTSKSVVRKNSNRTGKQPLTINDLD